MVSTSGKKVDGAGYRPQLSDIQRAKQRIAGVIMHTPLSKNIPLSERYGADVRLKREDLQAVRSYKIRGAYNKISGLTKDEMARGVVCASAGNHAQGVAFAAAKLGIEANIFMPKPTPKQKIKQVKMFGRENVEIVLTGDTYDECCREAMAFCEERGATFIHPFDDPVVIEGQGTVGLDILNDTEKQVDYLFLPVGGGGLASGVSSVFRAISPETKIIGVEAAGAASMKRSFEAGHRVTLDEIDTFADGIAVAMPGEVTFPICMAQLDDILVVPEGKICTTILELYNESAIVVEPAGAASIAALSLMADEIRGKNVVCIVSGSNNDITRMEEIKERSMLYEGTKHYFIVRFPQRAGALREFLENVLGPNDDITLFQYAKKSSRERGPAIVGIEVRQPEDFAPLVERMREKKIQYEYLNDKPDLLRLI
ncbi:threonine ammonia-lyase IlvA [Synergistaceae bacterium OttesenSCG-928-I11]|nr:threonine ammonia-lyase IlvA [Synergistaceae bacterium OttesenSCG-928-I11]